MVKGCLRTMKVAIIALGDKKVVLLNYKKDGALPIYLKYEDVAVFTIVKCRNSTLVFMFFEVENLERGTKAVLQLTADCTTKSNCFYIKFPYQKVTIVEDITTIS